MPTITYNLLHRLPKVELHCHLDGCLRPESVLDVAKNEGVKLPSFELDELSSFLKIGKKRGSLEEYLNRFDITLSVMQTPESLTRFAFELIEDVSWNFEQNKRISPFKPDPSQKDEKGNYRMFQEDIDRIQEFRKCIECYLCQNVCHVLRDHNRKDGFIGPRFMIRLTGLDMHPLDTEDRIPAIKDDFGSGMCNITRCCTDVCPEHIQITDNGIIPLKERVVDRFYDPIIWLWKKIFGGKE